MPRTSRIPTAVLGDSPSSLRLQDHPCRRPAISPRAQVGVAAAVVVAVGGGGVAAAVAAGRRTTAGCGGIRPPIRKGLGRQLLASGQPDLRDLVHLRQHGKAWWLSMLATQQGTSQTFTGDIHAFQGVGLNAASSASPTTVGTGSITFSDGTNGSFTYTLNGYGTQTKAVTKFKYRRRADVHVQLVAQLHDRRQLSGPVVGAVRVGLGHQRHAAGIADLRDVVQLRRRRLAAVAVGARRQPGHGVYGGTIYRTAGPNWNNFDPVRRRRRTVGKASFSFPDGDQ